MATQTTVGGLTEEKRVTKTVLGGSLAESILGGATIVLALIGLSGILPEYMLPIAIIAMGAAFFLEGSAISMRFSRLLAESSQERFEEEQFGVGLSSEFVGGVSGVILGILALLRMSPLVLVSVTVIVYGSILMLSSSFKVRFNLLELEGADRTERFNRIAREAMTATAGVEFLLGLTVAILGILAITTAYTTVLSLVALLIVGITGFLTGAALSARMFTLFRR